jgi:hypothetical protein
MLSGWGAAMLLATGPMLTAATPTTFIPGLWQVTSTPGTATLNGRPLGDLPYSGPATPPTVCLTAAEAGSAAWLSRDLAPGCTLTRTRLQNGRVDVAATCPSQAPGLPRGSVRLTGRWTPTGYDLRFVTRNPSENGVMGFTGTMTGKRVGDC